MRTLTLNDPNETTYSTEGSVFPEFVIEADTFIIQESLRVVRFNTLAGKRIMIPFESIKTIELDI